MELRVTTLKYFMNCSPGKPVKKKAWFPVRHPPVSEAGVMFWCDGSWRRNFSAAGPIFKLQSIRIGTYAMQGTCSDPVLWTYYTFPDVVRPPINTPLPNSSFCTAPLARVYIIPC